MKRTEGISNPVDARRAEVERIANEDHAKHCAGYVQKLEARDRERTLRARMAAALAAIGVGIRRMAGRDR